MALDYSVLLYDPVYAELGVEATFTSGALQAALTVIDDTRPKSETSGSVRVGGASAVEVRGIGPGAFVRVPELLGNGITQADWLDAGLSFNGRSWIVRSYERLGSPNGEESGEVRFLLRTAE